MRREALGFLIGTIVLQFMASLPGLSWSWWLLLLIPAAIGFPRWRWLLCVGIAFCWANLLAHAYLAGALEPELEGKDVLVTGIIASLPEKQARRSRFEFVPQSLQRQGVAWPVAGKLLLNWYAETPQLEVGARWQLQVRLKQPHGFMNPGGFDYEAWLLRQGIRATGYVRGGVANPLNRQLAAPGSEYVVDRLRQKLRHRLNRALEGEGMRGIILALAMGDRQQITDVQWEVFTRTGTNHLVAISGLHVGLVAAFAFFAVRRLWRCLPRVALYWPAAKAGAVSALVAASTYALMAGFSVPTQRAMLMISLVMLGIILQRRTRPGYLLAPALILVLIMDPFAVLASGFWLSFAAVAMILFGMQRRLGPETNRWQWGWWRWGRVQWLVALGLFPLLLLLFQKASLVSPLANFIAVPWVSMITVPLTLLGTLGVWLWPVMGEFVLGLSASSLEGLWWILSALSHWSLAQWQQGVVPLWAVACAFLGFSWLILPRGVPARWVGGIWILPLVLAGPAEIPEGEAHFALLDVGQGLAAVVQTRRHTLVFDTGPRFPSGFNTGDTVVAAYLKSRGLGRIDVLMLSHGDIDHIGGVSGLRKQIPLVRVLTSVPEKMLKAGVAGAEVCRAGEQWQWDEVEFEILSPGRHQAGARNSGNNRSCVLRVQARGSSVLLSGDIEAETERELVQTMAKKLAADVLVVPHHGSATSSSEAFLDAVSPQIALFPLGYRNRFGFPKPQVVTRYRERGVRMFDTAHHGAIEIHLGRAHGLNNISSWRQADARYWRHQFLPVEPHAGQGTSSGRSVSLLQ